MRCRWCHEEVENCRRHLRKCIMFRRWLRRTLYKQYKVYKHGKYATRHTVAEQNMIYDKNSQTKHSITKHSFPKQNRTQLNSRTVQSNTEQNS